LKKIKFFLLITFVAFILTFLAGCFLKTDTETIDISDAYKISSLEQWAVVTDNYVAYKTAPSSESAVKAHGRLGEVQKITGNQIVILDKKTNIWYELENGWLEEKSIRIFSNRLQAERTAEKLIK
jgi:hypothetical protein